MGWHRVTHVVDISERIRWNDEYCARLLLKDGASPDDVIEIGDVRLDTSFRGGASFVVSVPEVTSLV